MSSTTEQHDSKAVVVQSGGVGAPDDSKTPTSSITLPLQLVSLKLSDSLPTERHEWYTNEVRLSFPWLVTKYSLVEDCYDIPVYV